MLIKNVFIGTIFDVSKRQNAIFWAGQLAVVLSTILGVYLAASAGLKTAIDFHSIISDEKNFYTLSALKEEVRSNNQLVLAFSEKNFVFNDEGKITAHRSGRLPTLNWFVWTTMTNATETLELPVDILKDTNRYYIDLTREINAYEKQSGPDKLFAGRRLYKLATSLESTLIKRMDEQVQTYRSRFSDHKNLGAY